MECRGEVVRHGETQRVIERASVVETFAHARRRAVLVSEQHQRQGDMGRARYARVLVDVEGAPIGAVLLWIVDRPRPLELPEGGDELTSVKHRHAGSGMGAEQ